MIDRPLQPSARLSLSAPALAVLGALCLAGLVGAQAAEPSPGSKSATAPEEIEAKAPESTESAESQETPQELLQKLMTELQQAEWGLVQANLLKQLSVYRDFESRYAGQHPYFARLLASRLASKLCAAGDYAEAHRVYDADRTAREPNLERLEAQRASFEGFKAEDAVEAIVKASQGQRAVIINEAHHVPQHRVLTRLLLPLLREQGFTHFAAETFNPTLDNLKDKGYPTAGTGTYTEEPLYADLAREAVALGYEVVAYESFGPEQDKDRELSQAQNLQKAVFAGSDETRVLVHVGYAHNRESPTAFSGRPAMAYHLRELTGVDPLTVDQIPLTERASPDIEHPLYEELCGDAESATVLRLPSGELWSFPQANRDITLCLPRTEKVEGRPTWLALDGLRKFVPLREGLCGEQLECLVEARPEGEGPDAIPIDRVVVRQGQARPALALPNGTFHITAQAEDGAVLNSAKLVVKP